MIGFFRRSANAAVIDRLYSGMVEASRHTALYRRLQVPDTFDGRFESLSLHAFLLLRRLQACPAPGPEIGQALVDTVFRHFDRTFREMGIGDTSVPKRMKTLAEAFLGRSAAYQTALLSGQDALAAALARNVYSGQRNATDLAAYVAAYAATLDGMSLQQFIDGVLPSVDPSTFATETTP